MTEELIYGCISIPGENRGCTGSRNKSSIYRPRAMQMCHTHLWHVVMFRLGIFPDKERRRQQKTAQIKHQI